MRIRAVISIACFGSAWAMLGLLRCGPAAADAVALEEATGPPQEQYEALLRKYRIAASSGRVLSDEERLRFVGEVYKVRDRLAFEFLELAEKHPRDPIAVDALLQAIWQVNTTPWPADLVGKDERWLRAFSILERDHIDSVKLGPACQRLAFGFRREYEGFLRAVLARSPHRDVRAQTCLALAHFLSSRQQRLDLIRDRPAPSAEFADLFGKEYFEELEKRDRTASVREAEALFERAAAEYGDVALPDGRVVAKAAAEELFEIRHLDVGDRAPEIEGPDQKGARFKLSDYRGKVVLLDFWQEY